MDIDMSRTKKGSKPPGYEYWSRRPKSGCCPDRATKKLTHQVERARAKEELLQDQGESMDEIRREVDAMPEMFEDIQDSD